MRAASLAIGSAAIALASTGALGEPPPGPCVLECPPDATPEGEPCEPGTEDHFNGGCNSDPPVYSPIACGETVCGTGWFDGTVRDTDWYEITPELETRFDFTATAEFPLAVLRSDIQPPLYCDGVSGFPTPIIADPCREVTWSTGFLPPDQHYYFIVAAQFTQILDCVTPGSRYVAWLECEQLPPPCPWDFDGDGVVGFEDLLAVLANWGPCPE